MNIPTPPKHSRRTVTIIPNDYRTVSINAIERHPMNPKCRTDNVRDLEGAITQTQHVVPLIVCRHPDIPHKYIAINGNRRLTVAKRLGFKELEVILIEGDPIALWAQYNTGAQSINGAQWWTASSNCSLDGRKTLFANMPKAQATRIRQIIDLLGETVAAGYGLAGTHSPRVMITVGTIIAQSVSVKVPGIKQKDALIWLLDWKMNKRLNNVMRTKGALMKEQWRKLAHAIKVNEPVTFAYDQLAGKMVVTREKNVSKNQLPLPEMSPNLSELFGIEAESSNTPVPAPA
jgi:hypothetical protein